MSADYVEIKSQLSSCLNCIIATRAMWKKKIKTQRAETNKKLEYLMEHLGGSSYHASTLSQHAEDNDDDNFSADFSTEAFDLVMLYSCKIFSSLHCCGFSNAYFLQIFLWIWAAVLP